MSIKRRSFIQFMAGAGLGTLATPLPWKLLDDVSIWSQNWSWIPRLQKGTDSFIPVLSKACPSATAMRVRLSGERLIRTLPWPEHPLGGGISALAACEAQMLNSPSRIHAPLQRTADGTHIQISWAQAAELLSKKISASREATAFICGDENGSTMDVISGLAAALGSDDVFYMPSEAQAAAKAADCLGLQAQLGYDLENSDLVLAIEANIFESWGPVIRNRRIIAGKKASPGETSPQNCRFIYAGALRDQSGLAANTWIPLAGGSKLAFVLGLAAELIKQGRRIDCPDFDSFSRLALQIGGEECAKLTEVSEKQLSLLASQLQQAKAPLVIVGSDGCGAAPIVAGTILNALLGNINKPGGLTLLQDPPSVVTGAKSRHALYQNDLVNRLCSDALPKLLIIHEANPLYALPGGGLKKHGINLDGNKASEFDSVSTRTIGAALKDIPYKITFSTFMDETAAACDLILPIPAGLERSDDIFTPYGCGQTLYCINAPATAAMHNSRHTADVLLFTAKQLNLNLGFAKYSDVLQAKATMLGTNAKNLASGNAHVSTNLISGRLQSLRAPFLQKALHMQPRKKLRLILAKQLKFGTAKTGIPPFCTQTIRSSELDHGLMAVMMNSATAQAYQVANGERLALKVGDQSLAAFVRIYEGMSDNCLAVNPGLGHSALDMFSQNKGENIMAALPVVSEPESGLHTLEKTNVSISKLG